MWQFTAEADVWGWLSDGLLRAAIFGVVMAALMTACTLGARWVGSLSVDVAWDRIARKHKVWPDSGERAREAARAVALLGTLIAWAGVGWFVFRDHRQISTADVLAWLIAGPGVGVLVSMVIGRLRLTRLARWALV